MGIYRTCDLRGLYPSEVNEELFCNVGRRIARMIAGKGAILTGRDVRISSACLHQALNEGLMEGGADVLDAGLLPTPVIYFGKRHLELFAAVIVTASHNPPEENGVKLLLGCYPASPAEIRSLIFGASQSISRHCGTRRGVDLARPYLDDLANEINSKGLQVTRGTFIWDPGNGAWCVLLPELTRHLKITARSIHADADGLFPARGSDCAAPGSLRALGEEVRRQRAAAGIAWDGDGDRIAVCDNVGRAISTDQLAMLLLPHLMAGHRRPKILLDVKMSKRLRSEIRRLGGVPVVERSAHCYLERRMIDEKCCFGCEYSGHLFFADCAGADDSMRAALLVMGLANGTGQPLSQLLNQLPQLFITGDIRVAEGLLDFHAVRARIAKRFAASAITYVDGVEVDLGMNSFLVRQSVSERKLCFRFEGETAARLGEIVREIQGLLPEYSDAVNTQLARFQTAHT